MAGTPHSIDASTFPLSGSSNFENAVGDIAFYERTDQHVWFSQLVRVCLKEEQLQPTEYQQLAGGNVSSLQREADALRSQLQGAGSARVSCGP